jgi:ABC-type antimicrobial peptide transport system permease subunit
MHGSNGKLLPLVALISVLVAVLSSVIPACHVLKVDPSQVSRGL